MPPKGRNTKTIGLLAAVVVIIAVVIGAIAISSAKDDDDPAAHNTTTPARGTTDPRTAAQLAADTSLARSAVLQLSDFPQGWEGQASDPDPDSSAQLADCLGVDRSVFGRGPAGAESEDFSRDNATADSGLRVEPTVDSAEKTFSAVKSPKMRECGRQAAETAIRDSFEHPAEGEEPPEGLQLGEVTVGNLAVPTSGDDTVALRITVNFSAQNIPFKSVLDVIYVRLGRSIASLNFTDVDTPFDQEIETALVTAVTGRMQG
jgi:hypothetical protein